MQTLNKRVLNYFIVPTLLILFAVFVNRNITFESHSLGLSLQYYSSIFPSSEGVLQPHRILLPFLGHIFNLDLQILNLFILFAFLSVLFNYLQKIRSFNEALFICLCLCTGMFVQFHLNFGGYPDILSYLLLLLAYLYKEKPIVPYLLLFFALLVKETVIFTFLFYFSLRQISKLKVVAIVLFFIPIYLYLADGVFNLSFYIEPIKSNLFYWFSQSSSYFLLGAFSTIKFMWIVIFLFIYKNINISMPLFFLLLGISSQFILGGDTTRFFSFIFLGLIYIYDNFDIKYFQMLHIAILIGNIITKKYYVFAFGEMTIINESRLSPLDIYEIIVELLF